MKEKYRKLYNLILVLILILSGIIYFFRLGKESLVTDEYFSLYVAEQSPHDILFGHKRGSNPNTIPPLYVLILHYWLKLLGTSEFAQRSLSALFGILSVYLLYCLAKLLFDMRTGILSALFGSFSSTWFSFFRENRCYGLFILLTLLSFYIFFYLIKNKDAKYAILYLIIINILLSYTHYLSFLVILLEALFAFLQWKRYKRGLTDILSMCLIVVIFFLPWISNLLYDLHREPVIIDRTLPSSIAKFVFDIFKTIFSNFHFHWNPILTILYIPLLVRAIIRLKRKFSNEFRYLPLYLILIFLIPFSFIFFSLFTDRNRYYAPFMFPLLILLAYGIQDFNTKGIIKKLSLLSLSVFIISNNFMDFVDFFNLPSGERWKEAAKLVTQTQKYHKDNIFIFQTRYNPPVFAYYFWGPKIAAQFTDNVITRSAYEEDILVTGIKDKIYVSEPMEGKEFFNKLASFPEGTWIWIFRYHDRFFADNFRVENENRYFFHQILLNEELSPVDMFLLRSARK